jgi:uncharacterized membrane protein YccC
MEATTLRRAACIAWLAVGLWRLFVCLSLALAPEPPALALLALAGQVASALGAGFALARSRASVAELLFAAFVGFVVLQMGADALVYGIRSLLEALAGVLVALALAALGWLALREPRSRARAL